MPIKSSIASVAEFKGQQSPAVFQAACERIVQNGLDECQNILNAVVRAIEAGKADSVRSIVATLTNGNARLTGAVQQVGAAALPNAELSALETDYKAVKSASRAQYAPKTIPDSIREATRTVTDLCAGAHMNAMRLLPALEAIVNKPIKKPTVKKPSPADEDTGDFDLVLDASPNAAAPKPGDTGIMSVDASEADGSASGEDDEDFFKGIKFDGTGDDDESPSGDDLEIDVNKK